MRNSSRRLRARLLRHAAPIVIAASAAATAHSAHAQNTQTNTPDTATVGEVVVTAQFREQNLQQTPIAITAINAAMMEQRGMTDVTAVAAQAPNVTLKAAGGQGSASMVAFIRGIGQTDFNFALEPGVGIYVDDIYYATLAGSLLDLLDLERVEVLRGPQGTLAGRNSIGGAIRLYTRKPGSGGNYLQASYGSLNRIEARGAMDFTIVPDKLSARFSVATKHRNGYIDRIDYACAHPGSGLPTMKTSDGCKMGTLGGISYTAGRGALRWTPNDKLEVNLSADIIHDRSEAVANTLLYADNRSGISYNGVAYDNKFVAYGLNPGDPLRTFDPFITYANFVDPGFAGFVDPVTGNNRTPFKPLAFESKNFFNSWSTALNINYRIADNLQLVSISGFKYYDNTFTDDTDGSPLGVEQLEQRLEHRQWQQEVRLNGNFGDLLDFTLGGFYHKQNGILEARVDLPYVPGLGGGGGTLYGPLDFIHGPDKTPSRTMATFLHTEWHLTSKLTFAAGIRRSWEWKSYTYQRHNPDGSVPQPCFATPLVRGGVTYAPPFRPDNPQNCSLFGINNTTARFPGPTGNAKRWDWRLDANYKLTPDLMVYANIATGFKGGGVNPRPFYIQQELPFQPETLKAYEIGFKSQLFDRRVRFNAAGFFNKYNNMILTLSNCPLAGAPGPTPCALPANVGAADVKGLEFEVEARPTPRALIDASMSYLDFKYTRIAAATNVRMDMITPYTPKWKWSIGAQYEFDAPGGTITPRIDAAYQSKIYTNAINCGPILPATATQGAVCPVANSNLIDGYTVLNGRVTWRSADGDWQAAFEVTNFTDKLYYNVLFDSTQSAGYLSGTPGLPRQFGFTVKRSF